MRKQSQNSNSTSVKMSEKFLRILRNFKMPGKNIYYWSFLIVVIVFHIFTSLKTVSYGGRLSELEKEMLEIQYKNNTLDSKLVETSSLFKLKENSGEFGFSAPSKTLYISNDAIFAKLP